MPRPTTIPDVCQSFPEITEELRLFRSLFQNLRHLFFPDSSSSVFFFLPKPAKETFLVEKACLYFIFFGSLVEDKQISLVSHSWLYTICLFSFSLKKKKSLAQGQLPKPPDSYKMKNLVLRTVILSFFMEHCTEQT